MTPDLSSGPLRPDLSRRDEPTGDLLEWTRYFDQLDEAMQEFEVGLLQQDVEPLRFVPAPAGKPPEILHTRWTQAYERISELEFRARSKREEIRTEFRRLGSGRRPQPPAGAGYGSTLDISS